ncbi:hypothetical protein O181_060584 [Austropuccinia psidii MF-1]|uniref:Uncharacterized protein n=1 Tax=Austropuccinia psidii MF-1 TaxID=1389203 RepID=A0A9Q3HZS2_9BASI|nr:hypothetical protein [Austropuccinia psidii MF-1]
MGPTPAHWDLLDHVVGYLRKTRNQGICLCPGRISLNLWSDAGWGGDLERSQTGFVLKLGNAPYSGAINQLEQLVGVFNKAIFCNNQAAVQVVIDNKSPKQMRYLDRAFFFVNDTVRKHGIKITWVKTDDMLANALGAHPFLGLSSCTLKSRSRSDPISLSSPLINWRCGIGSLPAREVRYTWPTLNR